MKATLIAVCGLIAALTPAFAKDKANRQKEAQPGPLALHIAPAAVKPRPAVKASTSKQALIDYTVVAISPSERHVIRWYVHTCVEGSKGRKPNGLPPGLAKKVAWSNDLPSDWQKQCIRGQILSANVHKHAHALPDDVVIKLPPCPPGTILLAVNGRVLRVAYPTYEILDSFDVL